MNIVIARLRTGSFEAHAAGCKDILNARKYAVDESVPVVAEAAIDVVTELYPPSDFNYDPTKADELEQYVSDVRIMPCCAKQLGLTRLS